MAYEDNLHFSISLLSYTVFCCLIYLVLHQWVFGLFPVFVTTEGPALCVFCFLFFNAWDEFLDKLWAAV